MKLGKIFICINILVLSLLMLTGCIKILVTDLTNIIVLLFQMVVIAMILERDKNPKSKSHETFWLCECQNCGAIKTDLDKNPRSCNNCKGQLTKSWQIGDIPLIRIMTMKSI